MNPSSSSDSKKLTATKRSDTLFGGAAGATLGAISLCSTVLLTGASPRPSLVAVFGAFLGGLLGLAIGRLSYSSRTEYCDSELGTKLGLWFSFIPAIIILIRALGVLEGKKSGLYIIATLFSSVMIGLMIGGLLDRIYESILKQKIRSEDS